MEAGCEEQRAAIQPGPDTRILSLKVSSRVPEAASRDVASSALSSHVSQLPCFAPAPPCRQFLRLAPRWATCNHFAMDGAFEFDAVIQAGDGGGAFVFFPFDMHESFGTSGKLSVRMTVDGVPYSGKLMKYGFPQHVLGLLKSLRSQIGKGPGDTVKIILRRAD